MAYPGFYVRLLCYAALLLVFASGIRIRAAAQEPADIPAEERMFYDKARWLAEMSPDELTGFISAEFPAKPAAAPAEYQMVQRGLRDVPILLADAWMQCTDQVRKEMLRTILFRAFPQALDAGKLRGAADGEIMARIRSWWAGARAKAQLNPKYAERWGRKSGRRTPESIATGADHPPPADAFPFAEGLYCAP